MPQSVKEVRRIRKNSKLKQRSSKLIQNWHAFWNVVGIGDHRGRQTEGPKRR